MTDQLRANAEQTLMREMGVTPESIERRRTLIGLGTDDSVRILAIRDVVQRNADELTATFFAHLAGKEEARTLLANRDLVEKARLLESEHLSAMMRGDYGPEYVEQRIKLALLYSKAGLEARVFLGAYHHLLSAIGKRVMRDFEGNPLEGFENFMSLKRVAMLDIGLFVDVLVCERERVIRHQQDAIRELSTPVLQIRDRLLLLPIVGVIDSLRARLITETLLTAIRSSRAKAVVVDVTGVATIDSKVANHLLQTIAAARLMGATAIVTGLSSEVAQSLVGLGIDLARFNTVGDLQGGLEDAERLLGYRLARAGENGAEATGQGDAQAR